MRIVLISIGFPGSGKTTVLKEISRRLQYEYVSRDEIRQELFGHPHDQSDNRRVWQEAYARAAAALAAGKDVAVDSSFDDSVRRRDFIEFARKAGARFICGVLFDTPIRKAKEWNGKRQFPVPEWVIEDKYKTLMNDLPASSEGFDYLWTYRPQI